MTWTERRQEGQKKENTFGKLTCQVCIILYSLYLPQSYVCTYLTLEDSDDLYLLSAYFLMCNYISISVYLFLIHVEFKI